MIIECPSDWRLTKLSDIGEVNRGRSRHRPRHAPHLYGGSYPFIQTGDVKASGGRITTYHQTYSEAGLQQSRLWPSGTMCITIAANIAETGILQFPACFPDSIIGFIPDDDKCDVYFIEYVFRNLKRYIQHAAKDSGTVQDNINLETLDHLKFPIPPSLLEQKAISTILRTLDDKIELNRQSSKTMEALALGIFKSWFVDFDPVAAKVDGRKPFGMNNEVAALFPAHYEESSFGPIPKGWQLSTVGKEYNITMGQSPPGDTYNETGAGLPFYQGRTDFGFRYPKRRIYCSAPTRFAKPGDTLVSVRAPVGDINMAIEQCAIGRGVGAIKHKSKARSYTYYQMRELRESFDVFEGDGTLFGSINKDGFEEIRIVVSPVSVLNKYEELAGPMDEHIENNEREVATLTNLRNKLLPKLLSGEIRVKQAEKIIGEVA